MRPSVLRLAAVSTLLCVLAATAIAADWPTWRYDEQRRAASPGALAAELHLQWVRELPEPLRAWPFQWDDAGKLAFDVSYEPVAAGNILLIGSMVSDSITAYNTRSGEELWRFYADGPVRFAPVVFEGRAYAGSDDGSLYCLALDSGELLWEFEAAPRDRYLLGNARMVNTWPVRGAPVIRDGTVYFAAGVFPFMGTFIYALDAENGSLKWENSGTGSMFHRHQHGGAFAFGGVAPQGYLTATEELLLIPGGRTCPAAYDRATGEFVYFHQGNEIIGKGAGGYGVWAHAGWFHNPSTAARLMYAVEDGAQWGEVPADVVSDEHIVGLDGDALVAYASEPNVLEVEVTDRLGRGAIQEKYELVELFRTTLDLELTKVHIQAGDRVYASGPGGLVAAIDLPADDDGDAQVSWQTQIEGTPWSMIAADERLFVVNEEGAVFCFGAEEREVARYAVGGAIDRPQDGWPQRAATMLEAGDSEGFALVLGVGSGRLVHEIVGQSDLHVLVVEPDAERADQTRRMFDDAGYYGRRVAVLHADPTQVELPQYFASLVTAEDLAALNIDPDGFGWERTARRIFEVLRPYGGSAWLPLSSEEHEALSNWAAAGVAGAEVARAGAYTSIKRQGPLPGAGQWTHQYADSANSGVSHDSLARAPLGLLWYGGGYNNHNALPRHQNGPVPQAVGGRLFILGPNTISARDVYTGRELWIKGLPGVGHAFTSLEHEEQLAAGAHPYFPNQPGANYVGSNYVSVEDAVYVGYEGACLKLNPATGETVAEFKVPGRDGGDTEMSWGFVVYEDLLITGADPQIFDDKPIAGKESWNATSSDRLVVMDRHSGEVLWQLDANIGFRHNAIIAAAGKIFIIDGLSEEQLGMLERRGEAPEVAAHLMAFDARSGETLWTRNTETFGTWLSYSAKNDTLIQSGRHGARCPLPDEPRERMLAHRGATGEVIWERAAKYSGPIALLDDQIITGKGQPSINILTGKNMLRLHPLTGMEITRTFKRSYGCGTQNVSENLITFRSAAAGYYDLARDGGTGNFGGTKAGCTNNLIVADGVLNAPEYTRSCFCSYQLQTSFGLVHAPDVEMWTYTDVERGAGAIRRAGINFGAPGSRLDDTGTWWVEYPSSGASTLELPVEISAVDGNELEPRPFTHHSSWVQEAGAGMNWIAASGVEGATELNIELATEDDAAPMTYTLRLHFIEPDEAAAGERQFSIRVQDREVISDLDVARDAGGAQRALVQEVTGVEITDTLNIALLPSKNAQRAPVLCGIELVLGGDAQTAAAQNQADATCDWASAAPPTWAERLASALHLPPFATWFR